MLKRAMEWLKLPEMNVQPALAHLDSLAEYAQGESAPRRAAIIDMGSNSFRLIVVEYIPRLSFKLVDEVREVVRLSEGMAETGRISAAAAERALRAAHLYAAFCSASGIDEIIAAGTSALRDAINRDDVLEKIYTETGISVRVLSGEQEAYYGYLAAVNSTTLENGYVLDLGGGSVQITRVVGRQMRENISFPLGAVRMTEQYLPTDPPKGKEIDKLRRHLAKQFKPLTWFAAHADLTLVGLGGNVRLLARMVQKLTNYPMDELHGYRFSADHLDAVIDSLARHDVNGRKRLPGMKADRADIALAGALVVREAMRAAGFDALTVCSQSVREGLFYERFLLRQPDIPDTQASLPLHWEDDGEKRQPLFEHIRRAAVINLAHVYHFQEAHAQHVAHLTAVMFDQLGERMTCSAVERELLWAAAMLHDIGTAVDYNDHHKHSAYLILNAGLPGYTHREIALIALMARYHRKGNPSADELRGVLHTGDDKRLLKLSALLRMAEFLDRARDGEVRDIRFQFEGDSARMELVARGEARLALWAVEQQKDIFRQAFGLDLNAVAVSELEQQQ